MEQKCLKTSVYANDTVFNETAEQPIDVDFTLPDYCPDISKILKCRAVSRISSKGINGRNITVDGIVCITLMYSDQEGKLCSFEYQYPFNKAFELGADCTGANLSCKTKCEYINCRAVTSRKVDIHGAAGIYCRIFKRKSTEIISDVDDCNIELRRGNAPATTPMGYTEKYLIVDEEIEIGQGQPPICKLLRYDGCACVKECKIINDKIVVKGDMTLTVLYCPEVGNSVQTIKTNIPFSQIVDIEGITDSCECETRVEVAFLEVKPRTSATGETRSFMLNAKLLITGEAYCNNEIPVILDAYSRKYQADISKKDICFHKICENIAEVYHCKKNLDFPDGAINSISDIWCDIQTGNTKIQGNELTVNGTVIAGIIACDSDNIVSYYEKPIDFEYKYTMQKTIEDMRCEPQIEILSCSYTITGAGSIEIRVDLKINAAVYECKKISLLVDMIVDENCPVSKKSKGAMTIYFATPGETIWDIARRYNASVNEIMEINEITDEVLSDGRMILVPMM